MANHTLAVNNLEKSYGRRRVVADLSFSMQSGEIVGLLGPNGAGKTTTFYMIVGFLKSKGGSITLDGKELMGMPMHRRSQAGLSYLPQESSIFRKLTVEQNILLVAQSRSDLSKKQQRERTDELLEEFGLTSLRKQKGYTLSGGERRRCEIARCLASDPKFLLLDEPFAGIDPKAVAEIKSLVRAMADRGIGILLTDHNVVDTLSITTTSHIISNGEILVSGDRQTLLADAQAREIYFGQGFGEQV